MLCGMAKAGLLRAQNRYRLSKIKLLFTILNPDRSAQN